MNKIKWLIALLCTIVAAIVLSVSWQTNGAFSEWQAIAMVLIVQGLIWLSLPAPIKEFFENTIPDPRFAEIDWPDEWQDFVALAGMIIGVFVVFL